MNILPLKSWRSVQTGQRSNERECLKLHLFRTFPALIIRNKTDCKKIRNKGAFEKVCVSFWYKLFFRVIRELNFDREPITASECFMDNHKIYQTLTLSKNSINYFFFCRQLKIFNYFRFRKF